MKNLQWKIDYQDTRRYLCQLNLIGKYHLPGFSNHDLIVKILQL